MIKLRKSLTEGKMSKSYGNDLLIKSNEKNLLRTIRNFLKPKYSVTNVFGCSERIPPRCPTFLDRDIHRSFANALEANNIIIVYGESRQGKTWAIEKYCKKQIRINCVMGMSVDDIKKRMVSELGFSTAPVEHITRHSKIKAREFGGGVKHKGFQANAMASRQRTIEEQVTAIYPEIDVGDHSKFIGALNDKANDRYFVFDNFHYLSIDVQQAFCSLLRDFNYHGIKIIIIGVWKEASRITSYAPDLINRCAHIDIGTWQEKELLSVATLGESALNIKINPNILKQFAKYSVHNIGIFKDFLLKFCQENSISKTQRKLTYLDSAKSTDLTLRHVFDESYKPLKDRLINLSTPKRDKQDSRHMRKKIVCAVLELIASKRNNDIAKGIELNAILYEISKASALRNEPNIPNSNITQELGVLHQREENKGVQENFIPLFYFDTAKRKLFVLEPTVYFVKSYAIGMFRKIIDEINSEVM